MYTELIFSTPPTGPQVGCRASRDWVASPLQSRLQAAVTELFPLRSATSWPPRSVKNPHAYSSKESLVTCFQAIANIFKCDFSSLYVHLCPSLTKKVMETPHPASTAALVASISIEQRLLSVPVSFNILQCKLSY